MPSERQLMRARPLGSWLLGPEDEGADRLWLRVQILLTGSQVLANLVGTVLVTTLLALVIPGEPVLTSELAWINFIAVPAFVVFALAAGSFVGSTWTRSALRWFLEDRDADRQDRIGTLRLPYKLTIVSAALWLIGTALFTVLYGLADTQLIAKVALTSLMGGIVVCANSYLLSEFALRPIAARALAASPPRHAIGVGLTIRSMLMWLLGGIPVTGMMLVALVAVIRQNVSVTRLGVAVLVLGAIAVVTGFGLMVMNTRAMVAPIRSVTAALAKVQRGDLDTEVLVFDGTELGLLQTGFNRMVSDVREREKIRDLFGRHVGEDVAKAAMSRQMELGGEVRDVAVLFIDVVGSTTIAVEQPPQEVVKLLNRFFAVVVAEVHEHGGFVNKFEGDALLAIFGAPEDMDDAAGHALAAARTMTDRLRRDVPECDAGVGVSAGEVVAGNVGAESRFEYTVIGDPVNEAARLSEHAKTIDGRVVASMRAVEAASPHEAERWSEVDEVELRGRLEPTRIAAPVRSEQ
jgi:adenylate cyclase